MWNNDAEIIKKLNFDHWKNVVHKDAEQMKFGVSEVLIQIRK